ncbi:hypothetical protein F9K33_16385 [bacterium]|nr:MAG: hypothetical protein F9K33_16385 [bacterium]
MKYIELCIISVFLGIYVSCATVSPEIRTNFWERTRYFPSSNQELVGLYTTGYGLSGETLGLFENGTFEYDYWCDVCHDDNVLGLTGLYSVDHDTIRIKFLDYKFSMNAIAETRQRYRKDFARVDSLYKTRLIPFLLIKKIGMDVLLLHHNDFMYFSDFLLEHGTDNGYLKRRKPDLRR